MTFLSLSHDHKEKRERVQYTKLLLNETCEKIGLWGVTRFPQLEGIPLLGGYGGSVEGL